MTMDFSLYLNPQTRGAAEDRHVIEHVTSSAVRADLAGFRSICLTEHHFNDYNTYADPFVYGAFLAGRLRNAWLGLTVATLPLHHPMRFAEQVNLLDQLTRGRLFVGIGVGGSNLEFEGMGIDIEERHDLLDRHLELARRAWALPDPQGSLTWSSGRSSGLLRGRVMPAPFGATGPLLARACLSDESTRAAGHEGLALLMGRFGPERAARQLNIYRESLDEAGHTKPRIEHLMHWSGLAKMIFVGEDDAGARDQAEPIVDAYITAANRSRSADNAEAAMSAGVGASEAHVKADYLERAIIIGGPETVARQLADYAEIGLGHLMLWFSWGFMSADTADRSLTLFIDEVVPRYHALKAQSAGAA